MNGLAKPSRGKLALLIRLAAVGLTGCAGPPSGAAVDDVAVSPADASLPDAAEVSDDADLDGAEPMDSASRRASHDGAPLDGSDVPTATPDATLADSATAADTPPGDPPPGDTSDSATLDAASADTFSADTFSADTFSADTFSTDTFSADTFSADTFSADTETSDSLTADSAALDTTTPPPVAAPATSGGATKIELGGATANGAGWDAWTTPLPQAQAIFGPQGGHHVWVSFCVPEALGTSAKVKVSLTLQGTTTTIYPGVTVLTTQLKPLMGHPGQRCRLAIPAFVTCPCTLAKRMLRVRIEVFKVGLIVGWAERSVQLIVPPKTPCPSKGKLPCTAQLSTP